MTDDVRLGVLAFGDSITNGGGELQFGVALQSWALWVARGLGMPYSPFAADGAFAGDVIADQLPAWRARSARPDARYDLGCLYVGTNDVRLPEWDQHAFAALLDEAMEELAAVCDRTLTLTVPLDLGRPRAGAKVEDCNRAIEAVARRHGTLVVDLRGFRGRRVLMADHVHPTALGQVAIATRALQVLEADGMAVRAWPADLVDPRPGARDRLRADAAYTWRSAKGAVRSAWVLARLRAGA